MDPTTKNTKWMNGKEVKIKSYDGRSAAMRPVSRCVPNIDCQSVSQTQGAVTDNVITPPPIGNLYGIKVIGA